MIASPRCRSVPRLKSSDALSPSDGRLFCAHAVGGSPTTEQGQSEQADDQPATQRNGGRQALRPGPVRSGGIGGVEGGWIKRTFADGR